MFLDIESQSYIELFNNILIDKDELLILSYNNNVLKLSFNKSPYFMLDNNYINTFEYVRGLTNRPVKRNECFYIIKNISKNRSFIIPQTELGLFLTNKKILLQFLNINKVKFNPLMIIIDDFYHGTPNKKLKSIKDLDVNRGNTYGDYGKGVYLTNVFNLAKSYSITTRFRKQIVGNILRGKWCNDSMDKIIDRLNLRIKNNDLSFTYFDILRADNIEFKVKIFVGNTEEWRKAIWDGWIKGKQQSDCDVVLGPISVGYMPILQRDILFKLNRNPNDIRKEIECRREFERKIDIYKYEGENSVIYEGFQLCIYNQKVLDYFI